MAFALPYFNDAVGGTVQQISPNQALIYSMKLVNTTGSTAYLQIFGKPSADVTLGSTVADAMIRLAANESLVVPMPIPLKISDATGLSVAGTTTPTGASAATISVTAFYG